MKEFLLNMTSRNYWLWFHVFCAGLWSWGWKTVGVDHVAIFQSVVVIALGYEVLQYLKMHRVWTGWQDTPYKTQIGWVADMLGDIIGAVLISYWILF